MVGVAAFSTGSQDMINPGIAAIRSKRDTPRLRDVGTFVDRVWGSICVSLVLSCWPPLKRFGGFFTSECAGFEKPGSTFSKIFDGEAILRETNWAYLLRGRS